MEEKQTDSTPCEKENKKISKRYLAFYIIGLFSVALVLILLSYVTQLRADKQLANLNSELAEKNTTVQGVQKKLIVLQDTVSQQEETIKKQDEQIQSIRSMLGITNDDDLNAVLKQRLDERDAYYHLSLMQKAVEEDDDNTAKQELEYLNNTYTVERLNGTNPDSVFTGSLAEQYLELANEISK